jgi:hypothetical protein
MKSKAILIYSIKNDDNTMDYINLEDSNLHAIDKLTSKYASIDELKNIPKYKEQIDRFLKQKQKIDSGEIKLFYIENKDYKEELKILLNEKNSLKINKDITNETITEFEKARKLLWSSKNNKYLKLFLKNDRLKDTLNFMIKIQNKKEYKLLKDHGMMIKLYQNSLYTSVIDILRLKLILHNVTYMREIYEETLESWRKYLEDDNMSLDNKYYYGRELKFLYEEYKNYLKRDEKSFKIKNLQLYNLTTLKNTYVIKNSVFF